MSEGWFWKLGSGTRVRGKLFVETGRNAEVALAGAVAGDPRMMVERTATVTTVDVSGDPADYVAAFEPVDLHGQLDSGELVSLLSAQNHGLFEPAYIARVAVWRARIQRPAV